MVGYTCNASNRRLRQEAEAGVKDQPRLHSEFQTSLERQKKEKENSCKLKALTYI